MVLKKWFLEKTTQNIYRSSSMQQWLIQKRTFGETIANDSLLQTHSWRWKQAGLGSKKKFVITWTQKSLVSNDSRGEVLKKKLR
jgi:hypothetical protein